MTSLEFDLEAQLMAWRREAADLHRSAARLGGAERAAATAHANTKEACANALRRLLWRHGVGVEPGNTPSQPSRSAAPRSHR